MNTVLRRQVGGSAQQLNCSLLVTWLTSMCNLANDLVGHMVLCRDIGSSFGCLRSYSLPAFHKIIYLQSHAVLVSLFTVCLAFPPNFSQFQILLLLLFAWEVLGNPEFWMALITFYEKPNPSGSV